MVVKGPLTSEQKQSLIASYHRHNRDVARAAAEVGVTMRTAYLWIGRFEEFGESGLAARSHARRGPYPARKASDAVAARVADLRRTGGALTVRRIAERLKAEGTTDIGKSSVAALLKKAGMNGRSDVAPPVRLPVPIFIPQGSLDLDRLGHDIRRGIDMDVRDRPLEAIRVLGGVVWGSLPRGQGSEIDRLLRDEQIGRLLLRSGLQLGHSLMNAGRWAQAAEYLRLVKDWVVEREAMQDRYDRHDMAVSLRRDDIVIECWEYLAIVLRETDRDAARASLDTAIARVQRPHRGLAPTDERRATGNLFRSRAKLRLRVSGGLDGGIEEDLQAGEGFLEETDDPGWHAGRHLTWAQLHHFRSRSMMPSDPSGARSQRDAMERAIARMLSVTETMDSPILRTKFYTDAVRLYVAHGMGAEVSQERTREAAAHCVRYGYAGQAHHLLNVSGIERWLPEELLSRLRPIARRT